MTNVIDMPKSECDRLNDELFGVPLHPSWHSVVIDGRKIPNLLIREWDGNVEVLLNNRWIYIFPDRTIARIACDMAANAMAISMGYPYLGALSKDMPFAPEVIRLNGVEDLK